jgi:hypothetical protein
MGPEGAITAQFSYRPGDIEHAHRVYESTKPMFWVSIVVALCTLASGCLALYGAGASYAYSLLNPQVYPFVGGYPLLLGMLLVLLALAIWFEPLGFLMRRVNYRRNPAIYGPQVEMEFTDAGVSVARHASREMYEWRLFGEAIEGSREFLLTVGGATAFLVVPKRALSETDREAFRVKLARGTGKLRAIRWAPPLFL